MEKHEWEEEDDEQWVPPTEAEVKVLQARRERSDKISKIMGQYMLSGYKMLNSVCSTCGTILLQDRRQALYCVACSEVDNEHTKDNPALGGDAAKRQIEEGSHKTLPELVDQEQKTGALPLSDADSSSELRVTGTVIATETGHCLPKLDVTVGQINTNVDSSTSQSTAPEDHLREKIRSTATKLTNSHCVSDCIQYCALIKACAEALSALRSIDK